MLAPPRHRRHRDAHRGHGPRLVGVLYRDIKKDRRGHPLAYDDIGRYQRICAALAETPRLMARIDGAIAARGGWPIG